MIGALIACFTYSPMAGLSQKLLVAACAAETEVHGRRLADTTRDREPAAAAHAADALRQA